MTNDPWILALMIGLSGYVCKLWFDDFRSARAGQPNPKAIPGATPAPRKAVLIACVGAAVLLAIETWGEIKLGLTDEQSKMTALFAFYTLFAAIVEEIIFRGFIVYDRGSRLALWGGVVLASFLFAALHPYLWEMKNWEMARFFEAENWRITWQFTPKAWFTTAMLFAGSLWFYAMRFSGFNPQRSLLPCFAAHFTKNAGVIAIKAAQGFLVGWA